MISIITIILFFLYFFGFGFTLLHLFRIKESPDLIERNLMRIGFGIPIFIVFGVLLNLVNIPLHWWIFLLPLVWAPYLFYQRSIKYNPDFESEFYWKSILHSFKKRLNRKHLIYFLLLLLFIFNFFMYLSGSFAYSYLEDSDPYIYAREMKYVSIEKTLDVPYFRQVNYLDPYPPAYSMIMGILHQTSPEAQWTLKFFNSLIISLSIIFFFFMVKVLTKNSWLALSSTFILSMLPSYLSHFIWSHSLIPLLFFLLIYSYMRIGQHKRWWIIASIATASILLTHHRQSIKLAIMAGIFFCVIWLYEKKLYKKKFPKEIAYASVVGGLLSLAWWLFKFKSLVKMLMGGGSVELTAETTGESTHFIIRLLKAFPALFNPAGGTSTKAYTFTEFFIAEKFPKINSPHSWGIVITILLTIAVIILLFKYKEWFTKKKFWIPIVLLWFVFTFLGVNSVTFHLPIGLGAFRMWMLLAIPVSILAGQGILYLAYYSQKISENLKYFKYLKYLKYFKYFTITLIIFGVILTSGIQKYTFNTSDRWEPGGRWTSYEEVDEFVKIRNSLPVNTKIFTYGSQTRVLIGFNMFACVWCPEYREFKKGILEKDMITVHSWLKEHEYEYFMFSGMDAYTLGLDYGMKESGILFTKRINEALDLSDKFQLVYRNGNKLILFRVL